MYIYICKLYENVDEIIKILVFFIVFFGGGDVVEIKWILFVFFIFRKYVCVINGDGFIKIFVLFFLGRSGCWRVVYK